MNSLSIRLLCFKSSLLPNLLTQRGHKVFTVDLSSINDRENHVVADALDHIDYYTDVTIACPPCQFLAKAQYHLLAKSPARREKSKQAIEFVDKIWQCNSPQVIIENPIGVLSKHWKRETQIIRPWYFGDPYTKDVCLWLKGVPPLISTVYHPNPKYIGNHVNGRMSQALKSSIKSSWNYFPGMCTAMVSQWF